MSRDFDFVGRVFLTFSPRKPYTGDVYVRYKTLSSCEVILVFYKSHDEWVRCGPAEGVCITLFSALNYLITLASSDAIKIEEKSIRLKLSSKDKIGKIYTLKTPLKQ